jgi:type III restriction enzyme
MNSLEKKVGDVLDKQEKILWWFRNKVSRQWYSIQGWREYKLHPDFVAARKKDGGGLEITYILESKGEQLAGNEDTLYKKKVFELMTDQNEENTIKKFYKQPELPFDEINDNVGFYFVEDGKEEEDIRKLFK